MMDEKKIKIIKILNILCPILLFIDLVLGLVLVYNDINMWKLRWLWIIEGILIFISFIISIYRIIITRGEYKKHISIGFPILSLILFLNGILVYSGILYFDIKSNIYNEMRMNEIKNDFIKGKHSIEISYFGECNLKHDDNLEEVAEIINSMNFKEVGYGVKECIRENVILSVEISKTDYSLWLTFYRGTPWIHYSLMDGDILPHKESFYIKCDNVEIESLYNYIVENHELFHKIEKNGEE